MWKCDTCGEEHEDQFTSCWKCSVDEGESPGVGVSPETYAREESIDEKLARRFTCPKCSSKGAESKRIATTGTGFSKESILLHFSDIMTRNYKLFKVPSKVNLQTAFFDSEKRKKSKWVSIEFKVTPKNKK